MTTAYVVVALMAIAANTFAATGDFLRFKFVVATTAKVGVPGSWLPRLGALKAAGALGLLVGLLGVPLVGTAAAVGLVLFYVGAILTHLRVRDYSIGPAVVFLLLATAALIFGLAS